MNIILIGKKKLLKISSNHSFKFKNQKFGHSFRKIQNIDYFMKKNWKGCCGEAKRV